MANVKFNRRDFVSFIAGTTGVAMSLSPAALMTSCSKSGAIAGVSPSSNDELILSPGLKYDVLVKWGDKINESETFGFNNDYLAFFSLSKDEALLWVNHEYPDPKFVSGWDRKSPRTKEQVDKERDSVGGSILHLKKKSEDKWEVVQNSKYNRRLTATTKIPYANGETINGRNYAVGTFAGCAGGMTPWGSVLSCEENYQNFYGDVFKDGSIEKARYKWDEIYQEHPHQYGWTVEVNPKTGEAKKLVAMGRMSRECATTIVASDGRCVVYSGDDKANEHIYKFISKRPGSLDEGELFVADIINGRWLSLDREKSEVLKKNFKNQKEVLIHARVAAKLLGATPCDRPEDVEISPKTKAVFVTLTNNINKKNLADPKNNFYGSILKIKETNADPLSLTFKASDFAVGGQQSGFACPDNLMFDKKGNLWMTTDISGSAIGRGPYASFKNNGLFYFEMEGPNAGKAIQVASAPVEAELTGLMLSEDAKTLFLSVQHPGEKSKSASSPSSHWPLGGNETPRPAVVQITGETLLKVQGLA